MRAILLASATVALRGGIRPSSRANHAELSGLARTRRIMPVAAMTRSWRRWRSPDLVIPPRRSFPMGQARGLKTYGRILPGHQSDPGGERRAAAEPFGVARGDDERARHNRPELRDRGEPPAVGIAVARPESGARMLRSAGQGCATARPGPLEPGGSRPADAGLPDARSSPAARQTQLVPFGRQGGSLAKNFTTSLRRNWRRTMTAPAASSACS